MKSNDNTADFGEKSDYEKKLIEFTRAVNIQSDKLRKADIDHIGNAEDVQTPSDENQPLPDTSKLDAYAL